MNILALTYWSYREGLVQTYTLPYLRIISEKIKGNIFLVTLEKKEHSLNRSEIADAEAALNQFGIHWIRLPYRPLTVLGFFRWPIDILRLLAIMLQRKITILHAWGPPAAVIGYILSVISKKRLVIDSYEPHADAMIENGTWGKGSIVYKLLFWFEKKQSKRAMHLIGCTESMQDYTESRYGFKPHSFFVKPACVDLELFDKNITANQELEKRLGLEDHVVCIYAGKLGGIYLDQEMFDFLKVANDYWQDRLKVLILTDQSSAEILNYATAAGLSLEKISLTFVDHEDIPPYMKLADFAITPVKPVPSKRHCTPIKNGEYWAMGLPVVITRNISEDSEIIEKEGIGAVIHNFNESEYLRIVKDIDRLLNSENGVAGKIRDIAVKYRSFEIAKKVYERIYG